MEAFYQSNKDMNEHQFKIGYFTNMNFPPHLHNSFELLFMCEGSMTVTLNNKEEQINSGDVAVILSNEIHSYNTTAYSAGILLFFADNFLGDSHKIFSKYTLKEHVVTVPDSDIEAFIRKCGEIGDTKHAVLYHKGYLNTLLYKILSNSCLVEKTADIQQDLLRKSLIIIQQEYDKGINLNEAAKNLGMSRAYISQFFRKAMGCGFNEYVNKLRVEKAKNLLVQSKLSILDVALECGFDNQRSFDRVFLKFQRSTPSKYKKKNTQ